MIDWKWEEQGMVPSFNSLGRKFYLWETRDGMTTCTSPGAYEMRITAPRKYIDRLIEKVEQEADKKKRSPKANNTQYNTTGNLKHGVISTCHMDLEQINQTA